MGVVWNKLPKRLGRTHARKLPRLDKSLAMRLMEKPGASTSSSRSSTSAERQQACQDSAAAWGEKRGGVQQTQYMRRLVDLRDELINQEETALARALDRLRLHSISNRDAARYRLKIKDTASGGDTARSSVGSTQGAAGIPRSMMTTVEKFRQMRPQRRQPIIFPLQGRQLIESAPSGNGSPSTRSSTEESARSSESPFKRDPGIEDPAKNPLQRLMFPTSSIPNIGRKALRQQEMLELKTLSLNSQRHHRLHKSSPRPPPVSPFLPLTLHRSHRLQILQEGEAGEINGSGEGVEGSEEGEFLSSPHAFQLETMTDGDRLDMDKLNNYYHYVYNLSDTPRSQEEDSNSIPLPNPEGRRLCKLEGSKPRRIHSERPYLSEKTYSIRPYSDRTGLGSLALSSDTGVETSSVSSSKRFTKVNAGLMDRGRVSLPVISSNGETHTSPSVKKPNLDTVTTDAFPGDSPDEGGSTQRKKRHIVIDMPHIIFNSATPDVTREHSVVETFPLSDRPGVLTKTLKQNEIRQRELQNLLEDVKELNKRTETLNTHAPGNELDASSGVC